jgi:Zn-dependent M32 family carboxypeptidase
MTEEEGRGEEGKEEEEKVPRTLLKAMDDFYRAREAVFEEFDEILATYSKGEDIRDGLKAFRSKKPGIFTLIYDIFHKEVELEDKLDKAGIEQEKRDKIAEFKNRFSDLADEMDLLILEELGLNM